MMRFDELLAEGRTLVPLQAESLSEAFELLDSDPDRMRADGGGSEGALLASLLRGTSGSLRRVSPHTVVGRLTPVAGRPAWASIGVSPGPIAAGGLVDGDPGPRILVLVRPEASHEGRGGSVEQVIRSLRDPVVEDRLLSATDPSEIRQIRRLVDAEILDSLRVEHVLTPLTFRAYPETPLQEVVDLMARRGLQALPVVGQDMQVLGVVTAEEALRYALLRPGRGKEGTLEHSAPPTVRDIMSRSVMCVSEDQGLLEAAQIMVSKGAGQLPVIRDGEIVGVLTRDAVLGALFGQR